jgi:hypothetical protein
MLWSRNSQLHYPFENSLKDYSGNSRDGTLGGSGCVYATRPNASRCLYFPGTGYVTTPSFGLSGTVVVFACWVRCKYGVRQTIIGDGYEVTGFIFLERYTNTDRLTVYYADGATRWLFFENYFASPFDDAWLHLCVVWDYTARKVYVYRNAAQFGATATMNVGALFPTTARVKQLGALKGSLLLTDGYLANVQLWTLATMPPLAQMTANVNRLMLGMNPIW